jgi:hypothetical protein
LFQHTVKLPAVLKRCRHNLRHYIHEWMPAAKSQWPEARDQQPRASRKQTATKIQKPAMEMIKHHWE